MTRHQYRSITDGLLLVTTIVGWAFFFDWLAFRVPAFQRLIHPPPLLIVKDGQLIHANQRRELITKDELMTHLREQGIDSLAKVREAYVEGDGRISVVHASGEAGGRQQNQRRFA